MSLLGLIRHRGARCDCYRPLVVDGVGGLPDVTWPTQPTARNIRALPDQPSEELATKIFGRETTCDVRLLCERDADIAIDDGIAIRDGVYSGQRFRVRGKNPAAIKGRSQHLELACERTTEVFG